MNKQDTVIVVVLFALLLAWFTFQSKTSKVPPGQPAPAGAVSNAVAPTATEPSTGAVEAPNPVEAATPVEAPKPVEKVDVPEMRPAVVNHSTDEDLVTLRNESLELSISSWGACIKNVRLLKFREELDEDSDPVSFDFADAPPLAISGVDDWSTGSDFRFVEKSDSTVVLESLYGATTLRRTLELGEGYAVSVTDSFSTDEDSGVAVPAHVIEVGSMTKVKSKARISTLQT